MPESRTSGWVVERAERRRMREKRRMRRERRGLERIRARREEVRVGLVVLGDGR